MARVMLEFYRSALRDERPRIFGMMTPVTDSKFIYDLGVLKLEKLLDATMTGVSSVARDQIMALPDKPNELVIFYDPYLKLGRLETPLLRQLRKIDPNMQSFRKQFKGAKYVGYELGSCASDLLWRKALREMDEITTLGYVDDDDDERRDPLIKAAMLQEKVKNTVKNWIFAMPNLDYTSRGYNVTPKLAKLVQILKACEPQGESFRGIVFVQRRVVAHAMLDILRVLSDYVGFLRPQVITGHGAFTDPHAQQDLLEDFRTGTTNLLIATKFAEDLEIPACSCVIRFNIFESQVSYAYARTRSRGRDSHLIHMAERGNDVHRRVLSGIAKLDKRMQKWVDSVVDSPGSSSPPLSLVETPDPYRSDSDDEDDDEADTFVKDPTTSARIHHHNATTVVYRFAASLESDNGDIPPSRPLFEFQQRRGYGTRNVHICTVVLPSGAPIGTVTGPPYPTQSAARRAACLQTCQELFYGGYLDYKLFPRPPPVTVRQQRESYVSPAVLEEISDKEDDDEPASFHFVKNKGSGTRCYPRRKPDFWVNSTRVFLGHLYPTIIYTDRLEDPPCTYQPMLILTRLPLPSIDSFKLFFAGIPSNVHFRPGSPFKVSEEQLQLLHKYTIRICRAVSNKPFICKLDEMAYFIAPFALTWNFDFERPKGRWDMEDIAEHIPWDLVSLAATHWVVALQRVSVASLTEDIQDAVIQDRWVEFTRRYDAVRIRPDLTPLSKPADSPREAAYESLVEYCRARRKGFEELQDLSQPIIEVSRVPATTNLLNPTSRPFTASKKNPAKYLIPELCCRLTIPASTLRMALLLPSITRRLEDILLVKELNAKFFDHCIMEHLLHTAVSAPSASVEFDYERLELLGDAYLKYLSSVYLFVTNPTQHEGALHIARQRIISNRSLLKNADRSGLPQYIQSKPFTSKAWQPPNFRIFRPPKLAIADEEPQVTGKDQESPSFATGLDVNIREMGDLEGGVESENELNAVRRAVPDDPENVMAEDSNLVFVTSTGNDHTSKIEKFIQEEAHQEASVNQAPGDVLPAGKKSKRVQEDANLQWLGDKGVADVAEAIIGAAYITAGRELALRVTKAMNIPVPHIDRWTDFARKTLAPPPDVSAQLKPGTVEHIEKAIGHPFGRPHLLAQALTHTSFQGHEMTCYERLEFIGDAILDFLVIRYIFDRDGQLTPGALTLLKGAMVSNSTLAAVCVYSGLHAHLLFESHTIASSIQAYSKDLDRARQAEYTRAERESRLPGQYWVDVEQPKVLSDVVESVLGAIYVSDNFSPEGVEAFFDGILKPFFDKHITLKTLSHHPTKILFELFQSRGCQEFEIIKHTGTENPGSVVCDVLCHDIILASAEDPSAQFAARKASFLALDALEGDPDFMTRTCSCRSQNEAKKAARKAAAKNLAEFDEAEADAEMRLVEEMALGRVEKVES
ncbi:ribonuclease III [Ramaria rubella]|nr:ribonuclease III [Ramaria rubella]